MKDFGGHQSYKYVAGKIKLPAISIGNGDWNVKKLNPEIKTLDFNTKYKPDYAEDFEETTLQPETFNTVICLNVIEHTKHPYKIIENIYKILKPNGILIISTPFLMELHEKPKDYWRFTKDGLTLLCNECGFTRIHTEYINNKRVVRGVFVKGRWKDIDWREWSENYDEHTQSQREDVFNFKEITLPHKYHTDLPTVIKFFNKLEGELKVVEFGGGKGRLASLVLEEDFPIVCWDNYDISSVAIENTLCKDKRYTPIHLKDFPQNLDVYDNYNVCVMSDFIEHIKSEELEELLSKLKNVEFYYIKSPIENETVDVDWSNYPGTHILEIGWNGVKELFTDFNKIKLKKNIVMFEKNEY